MSGWTPVCAVDALLPDRGAAALVGDRQVALFRLAQSTEEGLDLFAVGHRDPFTGANVIARGLVGSRGDVPTVASPLHKQVFDLRSGVALDYPGVSLDPWEVRVMDGVVQVRPQETG